MINSPAMNSDAFFNILATAGSVFLLTALGAFLRKKGRLTDQVDASAMWLIINILLPALIINSVLKNPALDHLENIFLPPVLGFGSVCIGLMLGLLFYKRIGLKDEKQKRSFLLSNAINNYGFVPVPLVLTLYDRETLGVLFMHNVGIELAIWTIGILIISARVAIRDRLKRLLNGPLCAITSCLFLTYFDLDTHIPEFFLKSVNLLGQAAIPLALLVVGSLMYDAVKQYTMNDGFKVIASSLVIRLMLFPAIYISLIWLIPMSIELKRVMLIEAAQPAAMLPIVLAKQYNSAPQIAFLVILATSIGSLLTMPLWIHFCSSLIC